jgi:hypothetical protein
VRSASPLKLHHNHRHLHDKYQSPARDFLAPSSVSDGLSVASAFSAPPASQFLEPLPRVGRLTAHDEVVTSILLEEDFNEVADLRLSVFTPYGDSVLRRQMVARAKEKMLEVRSRGPFFWP